jgi:quinol monooxygenase YgiN
LGSVIWGTVATFWGIPAALLAASAAIALGTLSALRYRLRLAEGLNLEPAQHWAEPIVLQEPPAGAPTLVMVEYDVAPEHAQTFTALMEPIRRQRLRDGALRWELARDTARPLRFIESFLVESWAEHVRQHDRVTKEDQAAEVPVRDRLAKGTGPKTTHLTLERAPRERRKRRRRTRAGR